MENKNKKDLIIAIAFILFGILFFFLMDYFQKQHLLKTGIRVNAVVTGKYCEINTSTKDSSNYCMRLRVLADTNNRGSLISDEIISAFIKKASFHKYEEGAVVKVVYKKDDADHARLIEEIE